MQVIKTKRAIINVATGDFYQKQQERLVKSVQKFTTMESAEWVDLWHWTNFPPGSKSQEQSPYGFKIHALKFAYQQGNTSLLWLDSPAQCIKDPSPIFDHMETYGYYAMSHHDPLENWVGDTALKRFGMTREQLKGFHLPSGSCYGFDLSQSWVRRLFDQFCQLEEEGLFKSEVIGPDKWHRHDEAILALLLMQFNLPVFFNDPLFQSDSPECVIRSGANWTQDAKVYGE